MQTDRPAIPRVAPVAHLTVASAPFLIFGLLLGSFIFLIDILPIITRHVYPPLSIDRVVAVSLAGAMCALGFAVRLRWRFALVCAMPCCALGLLVFPIGTLLCAWALHALWRHRQLFYPFHPSSAAST